MPSSLALLKGRGMGALLVTQQLADDLSHALEGEGVGAGDLVGAGGGGPGRDQGGDDIADADGLGAAFAPARQRKHRKAVDELDHGPKRRAAGPDDHRGMDRRQLRHPFPEDLLDLGPRLQVLALLAGAGLDPAQVDDPADSGVSCGGGEVLGRLAVLVGEPAPPPGSIEWTR